MKTLRKFGRGIHPLLLLLLTLATRAQSPNSPAILRQVDDHYNHLTSLRARYSERYTGMGMDRTESGTLLLKKPGRMRWSYDQPAGKLFVLDGKFAWFYTPGDNKAQRIPASQLDDLRSPLRLLLGHTQLTKELDSITVTPDSNGYLITGVPKGLADRVQSLTLNVTPTGAIQQMTLEETTGAITAFTFSDITENVPVKDTDFAFTPPPGVTVVNGLNPI